jgi:uncharacterized membrane protein (Fun14 family)
MATCPKCFGALTENHRCQRAIWARITDAVSTLTVGGILGIVVCYAIDERPATALVLAAAALGAVIASAMRQAVGGRP